MTEPTGIQFSDRNYWMVFRIILVLAVALRLMHGIYLTVSPEGEFIKHYPNSDLGLTWTWSERILSGDVLSQTPFFSHDFQKGTPIGWYSAGGDRSILRKPPLYAYSWAAYRFWFGNDPSLFLYGQLILSLLHALLIWSIATSVFGRAVGLVSFAIAAVYGPDIFQAGVPTRDYLAIVLGTSVVYCLGRAEQRHGAAWWATGGVMLGLALLTRESYLLFALLIAAWIAAGCRGAQATAYRRGAAMFGVALAMTLSPLIVRNAIVGAPLLSSSSTFALTYIGANAPDSSPVGLDYYLSTSNAIFSRTDGSKLSIIMETFRAYQGDWWELMKRYAVKLAAIFADFEPYDNRNFYYTQQASPAVGLGLSYGLVMALALPALWGGVRRWKRHFLLLSLLATTLAMLLLVNVVGRYRLSLFPVLAVFAGVTVVHLGMLIREKRWRRAAVLATTVIVLGLVSYTIRFPNPRHRKVEYNLAYMVYVKYRQDYANAAHELETAFKMLRRDPVSWEVARPFIARRRLELARLYAERLNRVDDAIDQLKLAIDESPSDPVPEQMLATVYADFTIEPEKAAHHLAQATRKRGALRENR